MTESLRFGWRLPHWSWFLLASVVLVVSSLGLSICGYFLHSNLVPSAGLVSGKKRTPAFLEKPGSFDMSPISLRYLRKTLLEAPVEFEFLDFMDLSPE